MKIIAVCIVCTLSIISGLKAFRIIFYPLEISKGDEMRYFSFIVIAALLSVLGTGCTTITRGTKDVLVIESEPAGADIKVSNGLTGKTPASFKVARKEALNIKLEKEGYEPVEVNVIPKVSGAGGAGMAGNVLLGGLIGAAVDAGTGSMYNLTPNPVHVKLSRLEADSPIEATEKSPSDRLIELEALKAKGILSNEEYLKKINDILNKTPAKERLILLNDLKTKGVITEDYYKDCREKCLVEL